MINTITLSSLY